MCGTCGCSDTEPKHTHHAGETIMLETAVMAENEQYAAQNKEIFRQKDLLCINIVSSPGSGKTTLLEKLIPTLRENYSVAVIEGDQHTDIDAKRIAQTGAKVYQINTGKVCHLDAHQIGHAVEHLNPDPGVLIIENIGNLICPAMFNLGEHHRVTLISTTEGADKPLKYPDMFYTADWVIVTKMDLLDYVDFDIQVCEQNIRKINPQAKIIYTSAKTGQGLTDSEALFDQAYIHLHEATTR